jgi:predicted ArsR family transcriptional regulator
VRDTDPYTSWAAARLAVTTSWRLQPLILVALRDFGPMTHDQIIDVVRAVRPVSDSGVRTRVSELVEQGLVERHPNMQAKSRYGRTSLLWRVVQK